MQTIILREKRVVAPKLTELTFERPSDWPFEAGQFARLGLAVDGHPVMRAYSIASAPNEETLRFLVTEVPEGSLSPRLHELEPGAEVLLEGNAEGNLRPARVAGGKTLWLLATGSGLAPFLSIVHDPATWQTWEDVVIVESVRTLEEAAPARELMEETFPGELTVVVATTREEEEERRGDLSGRITQLLTSGELEEHVGKRITPEDARVILCGNPEFIEAGRAYAEAIAKGEAPINRCPTGGARTIGRLAELLGTEPLPLDPEYGHEMPFAVARVKAEGCIGCGWCEDACPVDAITGVPKHLYAVLEADCTGCGLCVPACPMDTIEFVEPGRSWTDEDARRAKAAYEKTTARRAARQAEIDAELERRRQTTRKGLVADILAQVRKSGRSAS